MTKNRVEAPEEGKIMSVSILVMLVSVVVRVVWYQIFRGFCGGRQRMLLLRRRACGITL